MADKFLDLSALVPPVLVLTLPDEGHTVVHITEPSEALVEDLQKALPALQAAAEGTDASVVGFVYDLAARLISCNDDGLAFTREDLRGRCRMGISALVAFFSAYVDFVVDMGKAMPSHNT